MDVESKDTFNNISLYDLAIETVFKYYIRNGGEFKIDLLPDPIIFRLIRQCLKEDLIEEKLDEEAISKHSWNLREKINISVWFRLLKYENYRPCLMQFFNKSSNEEHPISRKILNEYCALCQSCITNSYRDNVKLNRHIFDVINHGLTLGGFFSDASWYNESENILYEALRVIVLLPKDDISTDLIMLEWYHKLFHTYNMYFKLNEAARLIPKVLSRIQILEDHRISRNHALIYTEFSRYNFFRNDYNRSYKWILRAIRCLDCKTPVSTQIQVLRQASKVCVMKRDYAKAKFLIYQAIVRANEYYGPKHYKMACVLLDFGFYLLNSDLIEQSVSVYEKAYQLRANTFGYEKINLLVAIAEEDLAYALYVKQYTSGLFDVAMNHAKRAITVMTKVLPPGNLMLCSANRVKALILEEQALDNYHNYLENEVNNLLFEAENLHKNTLTLTKNMFGENNILTAKHYGNLGRLYQSMRRYDEAEVMHLKAIKIKEEILGKNDFEVGLSVGHLASLYNYHMFEFKKAEELYLRSIDINLKLYSESYSGLEYDYRGLINIYEKLNDDIKCVFYQHKLQKWILMRERPAVQFELNFYDENLVSLKEIIDTFDDLTSSTDEQNNENETVLQTFDDDTTCCTNLSW